MFLTHAAEGTGSEAGGGGGQFFVTHPPWAVSYKVVRCS